MISFIEKNYFKIKLKIITILPKPQGYLFSRSIFRGESIVRF